MSVILVHITPEQCSKEEILSETPSEIIACWKTVEAQIIVFRLAMNRQLPVIA
jgi:hypothetical protein